MRSRRTPLGLAGKVAVVTGAAQGIGLAVAEELHARGATVALLDVNREAGEAAAASLRSAGAFFVEADVRDRQQMADAISLVADRHRRLDVVVANAGVTPPPATLRTVGLDDFDRVIDINQGGVWNTVRPALEHVIAHRGHVVVVASVASFAPTPGGAAYMISKAAVEQLGRALRVELAAHGASAGVAYFGVVDTALARHTFDEDPLGGSIQRMLPRPLRRRITAEQAAQVLVDGVTRRAARTLAPKVWAPYALLRGAANVLVDARLTRDKNVHALLHQVEQHTSERREVS